VGCLFDEFRSSGVQEEKIKKRRIFAEDLAD
jgi:hypothetical protein